MVIIRKFNNEVLWAIHSHLQSKKSPYYFVISFGENKTKSSAILSQIRLIDAKKTQFTIGEVNKEEFEELKEKTQRVDSLSFSF